MELQSFEGISVGTGDAPTENTKRRIWDKKLNFALLSYSIGFWFAAILTVGITAFCLWLIWLDWDRGVQFSVSGWAQSIITFLLGAWITDRPKFFKKKH